MSRKFWTEKRVIADGYGGSIIEHKEFSKETGKRTYHRVYYEGRGEIDKLGGDTVEQVGKNVWKRKKDGMLIVYVEREHTYCFDDDVGYCSDTYPAICLPINQVPDSEKLRVASVLKRAGFNAEAEKLEKEWQEWREREREKERKEREERERKKKEEAERMQKAIEEMKKTIEYQVKMKMLGYWHSGNRKEEFITTKNKDVEGKKIAVDLNDEEHNWAIITYDDAAKILGWRVVKFADVEKEGFTFDNGFWVKK